MKSYFKYWGKSDKSDQEGRYHLLPYHCLDVAAVADVWLAESNMLLKQISLQIGKPESEARAIVLFYILLHDLGKFDARFQNFVEPVRVQLQGDEFEVEKEKYSHGSHGYLHFIQEYDQHNEAMKAVAGHHGYCDTSIDRDLADPDADEELIELDQLARREWVAFCLDWTGLSEIPDVGDIPMLAGLCSVADWIGSSITNFTMLPCDDLQLYYQAILPKAKAALLETGMLNPLNGAGFDFLFSPYQPRGIQKLLSTLPLKTGLTIVESDTGSGKTEFALAYASMLIQANLADGIVFGLPTQATANGLFSRIGVAAKRLFPDCAVTLAHGKSKYFLHPDENGFLYKSNKRAFLGSMSVATIDQVLMGVLGIKHQFIRSFGTRKSVLILDEIHSFDAYMYALIEKVLQGQHQAFSSVILLSATLPIVLKNKLLTPYGGHTVSNAYPLITHVDSQGNTQDIELDEKPLIKKIQIEQWYSDNLLPSTSQLQVLLQQAQSGAMVGIICNTVNDAQNLYSQLNELTGEYSVEIDLFHARYTFADRDRIEKQVLGIYGKDASRQGRILVATQVVEQSLDLDFDVMVSQIAPIEFLMQRMGRLWRHDRINTELHSRTETVKNPLFITLLPTANSNPEWKSHYQGSGFVYQNIRVLYRTEQYLNQRRELVFPHCYREAIEYVHDEQAYVDEPDDLAELFDNFQLEKNGSAYTAKMYSVLDSKPLNDVDPRCALLTREGEMTASVVLLNDVGELWHGGDYSEQPDREKSTVSIAKKHAKGKQDTEFYCIKAVVNNDIQYGELGVVLDLNK